jgi:ferredoxin
VTWSSARRITQLISLTTFVLLTASSVGLGWRWLPDNLFSQLDPLVGLAAALASRALVGFWAAALFTVALSLAFGRAWCGWLCPVGTLLNLLPARKRSLAKRRSRAWRLGKYATLTLVLGTALVGSLSPMILDPITILTRPLQELARPLAGTDAVGRSVGAAISRDAVHGVAFLSLVPLAIVLALNAIDRRAWCRDLCPLGALLGVLSQVPGVRRVVDAERCSSCGRCSATCPTDAIDRSKGHESARAECIDCMTCVGECPRSAISFRLRVPQLGMPAFQEERRDVLIAAGATALGLGAAALPIATAEAEILRPPSTDEQRLAQLCVRCGACYGACPTGVLRPSVSFVSPAGPWTPMLEERPAHCTLNCNRCAAPCPTDAIHTLTEEERIILDVGKVAQVNRKQCRAWARHHACMICQGVCPIAGALLSVDGPHDPERPDLAPIPVPVVNPSQCIGCNECMKVCPMMPPAIGVDLPPYTPPARRGPRSMPPMMPPMR